MIILKLFSTDGIAVSLIQILSQCHSNFNDNGWIVMYSTARLDTSSDSEDLHVSFL